MSKRSAGAVFVLLGPEHGEKKDYIEQLRAHLTKQYGSPPDQHRFYPADTPVVDVVRVLRTGDLFSSHRLVLLYDAEVIKRQDEVAELLEYSAQPNKDATLVLISDAPRLDTKLDTKLTKLIPAERKKVFWEMFEHQKKGWLVGYFRKQGAQITGEAAELILELVENNTEALRKQADRLCLFLGSDTVIGADDVERFIYHSKEENVFTLFAAIAEGKLSNALEVLEKMTLSGASEPVQLIAGLSWQFQNLYALKLLEAGRYSHSEAFGRLNIRSKRNQRIYATASEQFSREELEGVLQRLVEYDALFRTLRPAAHRGLQQQLVYLIMVRGGAPAASPHEGPLTPDPAARIPYR